VHIYWIAARRRSALLAMTTVLNFQALYPNCHCERSEAIQWVMPRELKHLQTKAN